MSSKRPPVVVDANKMTTIQDLFEIGMARKIPDLLSKVGGVQINVGAGKWKVLENTIPIDYPEYDAENGILPYGDGTVDVIHAYHFMEHIAKPIEVLKDFDRVLKVGGYANIVVPYYNSGLQARHLQHLSSYSEQTWETLFEEDTYDTGFGDWNLEVHTTFIMGVVERNLSLVTQLVKK